MQGADTRRLVRAYRRYLRILTNTPVVPATGFFARPLRYNFSEKIKRKGGFGLKIVEKRIEEVIPYENNPRINEDAIEPVAESIKQFGFKVPIIVDGEGVIIAGHTRYAAAQLLGMDRIPCVVANDLTPQQIKAFRLADNKTAELAEWDFELLAQEIADLETFDLDFTLQDFGFEEFEERRDFGHIEDLFETGMAKSTEKTVKETFGVTFNFPLDEKQNVLDLISKKGKEYFVARIVSEANAS